MPGLIITGDGSHSLMMDGKEESYHSKHGALTESLHVFIDHGFKLLINKPGNNDKLTILEVGLGTGLNCLLTYIESLGFDREIEYLALEPFPLDKELTEQLNYPDLLGNQFRNVLEQIHYSPFDMEVKLGERFTFVKSGSGLNEFSTDKKIDLVYFDAFAPAIAPELWTVATFTQLYSMMKEKGVLVTYCAKGSVKRAMKEAGFVIERLPGPPGKREMTRAYRMK